jgi:DNA-binding CsgD family transcriptional regulator
MMAVTSYPVVGSANHELTVDRVSEGIARLIGDPPEQVIGRPLLELLDVEDVAGLLGVLAHRQPAAGGAGWPGRLRGRAAASAPGHVVVVPLSPVGSCLFGYLGGAGAGPESAQLLARLLAPADPDPGRRPMPSPDQVAAAVRGLGQLTAREADIVTRLATGDRVPAIARALFLSQSTVRNRLSVIYRKFGVASQQELIDLVRRKGRIV